MESNQNSAGKDRVLRTTEIMCLNRLA